MKKTLTLERSFRVPMLVTHVRLFQSDGAYPVCPQCGITMERDYQNFCSFCGQRLDWKDYKKAKILDRSEKGGR